MPADFFRRRSRFSGNVFSFDEYSELYVKTDGLEDTLFDLFSDMLVDDYVLMKLRRSNNDHFVSVYQIIRHERIDPYVK